MAVKTTGAELKAFYRDDAYWPDNKEGNVWHEELVLKVNGVDSEDVDVEALQASDQVTIVAGWIQSDGIYDVERSFESYFKKWRKDQSTVTIAAKIPKEVLDEVKAAIKAAGGTIL